MKEDAYHDFYKKMFLVFFDAKIVALCFCYFKIIC